MAAPTITELPEAPVRGEDRTTFATKANDFLSALDPFGTEANALAAYVETKANEIGDSAAVIQDGDAVYSEDTGTANAYVMTLPGLTAYAAGQQFRFKAANANTGASTLNINALGEVSIKKNVSGDLEDGDIPAGAIISVIHDGTNVQLVNDLGVRPVAKGGTGADTASGARSNLGLGSLATLSSVNNGNWSGADLAVANGGTGASDAGSARANLGLGSIATRNVTVSTSAPSGGSSGDLWFQRES